MKHKIFNLVMKFRIWAEKVSLSNKLSVGFIIAALISGIATYAAFTIPEGPNAKLVLSLLYLNFFLLMCLVILLGRVLLKAWLAKKKGSAGSSLQLRFMTLFLVITAIPTILVTAFSSVFLGTVIQAWFGDQVYNAVKESRNVAEAYFQDYSDNVAFDVMSVLYDIDMIRMDKSRLDNLLANRLLPRGVDEAIIFDSSGKIMAKAGYTFVLSSEQVPFDSLERADGGKVALTTSQDAGWIKALAKIPNSSFYLYVGRRVDAKVLNHIERATTAVHNYEALENERSTLEITFIAIFIIVALLLMLLSAWLGMIFASRVSKPVVKLIDAADKVKGGNFSVRVDEHNSKDEISILTRTFNKMISKISTVTQQLEERRIFMETVLTGVSSGVVGVDDKGVIKIVNKAIIDFTAINFKLIKGKTIFDFVPELKDMLKQVKQHPNRIARKEIKTYKDGNARVLLVRVAAEDMSAENKNHKGFVFTFDDITSLQAAERKAAWADVARRVAHEIKNPLTPIQLSAERLKRKYASQVVDDKENFMVCIDTIIRQVSDIGRMVDEFSSFARMPAPILKKSSINEIVNQSVFMQKVANPNIKYVVQVKDEKIFIRCDTRQISQAIINILKNAQESIAESKNKDNGEIIITLTQDKTGVTLSISDNGKGLPKGETRNIITEPYITDKPNGTGLGLAIVKKIMEDNGGCVMINDNEKQGAIVVLRFVYDDNVEP